MESSAFKKFWFPIIPSDTTIKSFSISNIILCGNQINLVRNAWNSFLIISWPDITQLVLCWCTIRFIHFYGWKSSTEVDRNFENTEVKSKTLWDVELTWKVRQNLNTRSKYSHFIIWLNYKICRSKGMQ